MLESAFSLKYDQYNLRLSKDTQKSLSLLVSTEISEISVPDSKLLIHGSSQASEAEGRCFGSLVNIRWRRLFASCEIDVQPVTLFLDENNTRLDAYHRRQPAQS